jgi:hypothetical protein
VTSATPARHGIAGNYYLDHETGQEVMITDDRSVSGPAILGLMSVASVRVARGCRRHRRARDDGVTASQAYRL